MKRTTVRIPALAAALLMIFGTLAGCTTAAPSATSAKATAAVATATPEAATATPEPTLSVPSYLSDTSPITFDWYVDGSWYTRAKWGQDATSKYITKKTGVTINILIPAGDEEEKKNLMIATGEVPDFTSIGQWEPARGKMIDAGLVFSLNDLASKYAPDFWDVTTPSTVDWFTEKDGKIYGYPDCNMPIERMNLPYNQATLLSYEGFCVRKDMYEALGSPDMTTPDGFLAAVQAAKEKYPKVDGQALIPFSFGYPFVDTGNLGIEDTLCELLMISKVDANNKLVNRLLDPELLTWLKVLRKANEMGLTPKEVYIDKDVQILDEFKAGRIFCGIYAMNTLTGTVNGPLYDKDPNSIYIQIDAMQNSKHDKAQFAGGGLSGWLWTAISVKNKNPERAMKFMHYWLSLEGQEDFYLGDPAVTRTEDGKAIKPDIYALRGKDENGFCATYGNMDNYFMLIDTSITSQWDTVTQPAYSQPFYDFQKGRIKNVTVFDGLDPAPDSKAGIALAKSRAKWGELLPKMLLAASDEELDSLMAQYRAFDETQSAIYLPEMQANFDVNFKKLGKLQ